MREREVDDGSRWRNMRTRERARVKGVYKGRLCREGIQAFSVLSDIVERKYYASRARRTIEQGRMALADGFLPREPHISARLSLVAVSARTPNDILDPPKRKIYE